MEVLAFDTRPESVLFAKATTVRRYPSLLLFKGRFFSGKIKGVPKRARTKDVRPVIYQRAKGRDWRACIFKPIERYFIHISLIPLILLNTSEPFILFQVLLQRITFKGLI